MHRFHTKITIHIFLHHSTKIKTHMTDTSVVAFAERWWESQKEENCSCFTSAASFQNLLYIFIKYTVKKLLAGTSKFAYCPTLNHRNLRSCIISDKIGKKLLQYFLHSSNGRSKLHSKWPFFLICCDVKCWPIAPSFTIL